MKPAKGEVPKGKKRKDPVSWSSALESIKINDESWWCQVAMAVEGVANQGKYVSLLNTACEQGERASIYCLSYQKLLGRMETLSQERLDQCPAAQGVCHYGSEVLSELGRLPCTLVAQVTKYLIYLERLDSIARIEEEALQGFDGLVCRRGDSAKVNNATGTKSDEHNEEWQQQGEPHEPHEQHEQHERTVDCTSSDGPFDGPNLYVILTGFHQPDLPQELINAGVPLISILRIEQATTESREETVYLGVEKRSLRPSSILDLTNFWILVEEQRHKTESPFDRLAILTVPTPESTVHEDEVNTEPLKKALYDRVSFTVFEVFELNRAHEKYLKNIELERRIVNAQSENCDQRLYRRLLDAVPHEYVTLPFVMQAILAQVEASADKAGLEDAELESPSTTESDIPEQPEQELGRDAQTTASFLRRKLRRLNVAYELEDESSDEETQVEPDPELVLHGDTISMINRYLRFSGGLSRIYEISDISEDLLRILQDERITSVWDNYEESASRIEKYSAQLNQIRSFFDEDLNVEELRHYLHLLAFDKLIFNGPLPMSQISADEELHSERAPKRRKSETTLTLNVEQAPERSKSDSLIHHGKSVSAFADCSVLLELTDPRELLAPGYFHEHTLSKRRSCWPPLEEFDFVELLPPHMFAQVIHECLTNYDNHETVYFEPTDSILLRFSEENLPNKLSFEENVSRLRTPVCFREFCDHVIDVGEWMGCGPETCILRKRPVCLSARKKSTASLKEGRSNISVARSEHNKDTKGDGASVSGGKKARKKGKKERKPNEAGKQRGEEITSEKASSRHEKGDTSGVVGNVSISSKLAEEERQAPVIGYDLGRLRVQVSNRKTSFLAADGSHVRVEVEHWVHRPADLRISLTVGDIALRLSRGIPQSENHDPFHLTTAAGIILAFRPVPKIGDNWYPTGVDFQASSPSGLTLKLVAGDAPENPFYIQQSLLGKNRRRDCHVNREVCRKFLRNGTVLKYLDDGTIIVLRPNGDIVTCLEFKRLEPEAQRSTDFISTPSVPVLQMQTSKTSWKHKKSGTSAVSFRVSRDGSPPKKQEGSMTADQMPSSVCSLAEIPGRREVSRYTVLNHEGRRYEVLDEQLVSERHRLLVRTDTDYEVNERFTRRDDGTNMLLNSKGELIVTFTDGTRITTGYIIEETAVMCDWTGEELDWYFGTNLREAGSSTLEETISLADSKFGEEIGRKSSSGRSSKMTTEIPITSEGFLSVLLTCRVEHKNYATVSYDQSTVNSVLSMPGDLRVSISACGHYEVSTDHVNLKIQDDSLIVCSKRHYTCGAYSDATYSFLSNSDGTVFKIIDAQENMFEVNEDGSTNYIDGNQPTFTRGSDSTEDLGPCQCNLNTNPGETLGNENQTKPDVHGDAARTKFNYKEELKWQCQECRCDTRIFAVNRDASGCEYIRRSRAEGLEVAAAADNKTGLISYSVSRRPQLRRLITLEPVEVGWRSKRPQHCFLPERIDQTNYDGRQLLRSTYSHPYDWLFPFGKNGPGISQNSHGTPLAGRGGAGGRATPELLEIRILYGFKGPVGNPLAELQRALASYWLSLFGSRRYLLIGSMDVEAALGAEEETIPADFKNLEDDLRDIALAVKTSIDGAVYVKGLEPPRKIPAKKPACKSPRAAAPLKQDRDAEEFAWYRDCLRRNFILPYFESIRGACFLWIEEVISNVLASAPSFDELFYTSEETLDAETSAIY